VLPAGRLGQIFPSKKSIHYFIIRQFTKITHAVKSIGCMRLHISDDKHPLIHVPRNTTPEKSTKKPAGAGLCGRINDGTFFGGTKMLPPAQIADSAAVEHEHAAEGQAGGVSGQAPGQAHSADKKWKGSVDAMGKPDSHV
jgi:hypothetical protein